MIATQIRAIRKSNSISNGEVVKTNIYANGREETVKTGKKWGKTKMPGSFQWLIPTYSNSKGFVLEGIDEDKLNKLVKKARLKYERGSREGQYITEAYTNDPDDPFFRHSKMFIKLVEGDGSFSDNPIDQIMQAHLRARRSVRTPDKKFKMAGVSQEYEIIDKDFDKRAKKEEAKEVKNTMKLLLSSGVEKKSKICYILGMKHDGKLDEEDLDLNLITYIQESPEKAKDFSDLARLEADKLSLRFYIQKAREDRKITQPLDGVFYYNGETKLGRSVEDIELFLLDDENRKILEDLMDND